MLSIHYVSIMMRIFYIDWQQHWECDWTMNIGDQQNSHKWQTSYDQLTVWLPVTPERYWASFQVTRLFHKATVSHCDHFLLQHMYLLFETSPGWSSTSSSVYCINNHQHGTCEVIMTGWSQGWRVCLFVFLFVLLTSIWWGTLSSHVYTICTVYWSLGRRGYLGVSNVVLVEYVFTGQMMYINMVKVNLLYHYKS